MPRYRRQEIPEPANERLFPGHNDWVWTLALSPDEQTLAGGGADTDPRIHLWNVETGEVLGTLTGHDDSVTGLAFSLDGARLYSTSHDCSLREWDVSTRTQVGEPRVRSSNGLYTLAIAPDDTLAASGGGNSRRIFILRPGKEDSEEIDSLPVEIRSLAFSKEGDKLALGMMSGYVSIYMHTEGSWQHSTDWRVSWDESAHVRTLAFAPDGAHLVCGTDTGHLYKVGLASGTMPKQLGNIEFFLRGGIRSLLFADESTLLVGQLDTNVLYGQQGRGRLAIFSWPEEVLLRKFNDFWGAPDSLVLLGNGRRLLTSRSRTPGLVDPAYFSPACLDFGNVNLGRGKVGFKDAPDWLDV